jgi:hypothetical protein
MMSGAAPITRGGAADSPQRAGSRPYGIAGTASVRLGNLWPSRVIGVLITGLRVSCSTRNRATQIAPRLAGSTPAGSRPQSGP